MTFTGVFIVPDSLWLWLSSAAAAAASSSSSFPALRPEFSNRNRSPLSGLTPLTFR